MNARGIAAMILGWWAVSQVLLGDVLDRIGVFGAAGSAAAKTSPSPSPHPPGGGGGAFIPGLPVPKIPDIPDVPQGPWTGIPFSPVSSTSRATR